MKYCELDDPLFKQKLIYDMKCKKIKGFSDSKPNSDLIDTNAKSKLNRKLKRNQTISTKGISKVMNCFG